jgi:hypothetical protein
MDYLVIYGKLPSLEFYNGVNLAAFLIQKVQKVLLLSKSW